MSFLGQLRRALAYWVYTPPDPIPGEGGLSTHGIVDIALETREKRDVIRNLAFHMGTRRRYDPDRGGSCALNALSRFVVRGDSLTVSTDPTDYDDMGTYHETTRDAKTEYLRDEVLPDLVNAKVVQVTTSAGDWIDRMDECGDENTGVRPGTRFEPAVQALRWIDVNGTQHAWKSL